MTFIEDLKAKQTGNKKTATKEQKEKARILPAQKDIIFTEVLKQAGVFGMTAGEQYQRINDILISRDKVSEMIHKSGLQEDDSVVGGVTELICRIGLEAATPGRYGKLPPTWNWIGDYAITGVPFNLYISVKSYYARERLIVSGTGQGAAPVIGYGLFRDETEWSPKRIEQYRHRGFVAIYMPDSLYRVIATKTGAGFPATEICNIYNRPILRKITNFVTDIRTAIKANDLLIDLRKL